MPSRNLIKPLNFFSYQIGLLLMCFKCRLRHECCVTGRKNDSDWIFAVMVTVAVPIYQSRVSPVFDTCTRLLLIDLKNDRQVKRKEFDLDNFSLEARLQLLQKNNVAVVICGGISDVFDAILSNSNIRLICGICGNVDEVIQAHVDGRLDDPFFFMPGYKVGVK